MSRLHFDPAIPELPEDWRRYHYQRFLELDPDLRARAVLHIRSQLHLASYRAAIEEKPQNWWTGWHFHGGMTLRNILRDAGFGERNFGVENLDDYYVALVELAVMGDNYFDDLQKG